MMKKILYFLPILIVPLILYLLSLKTVVSTPYDQDHINAKTVEDCFGCHGEGKEFARSKDHPPKDQCFKCHGEAKPGNNNDK